MRFGKFNLWGPPKKFDPHFEERRISWLELFYDLVMLSQFRGSPNLAMHISLVGFCNMPVYSF
jgi:low temperature requirement protein LtrA